MFTSFALTAAISVLAPLPPIVQEEGHATLEEFAATLQFETGAVTVSNGEVTFALPEGWALLQSRDARQVVEGLWGNPEDPSTLAFIDPPSEDGRLGSDYGIIVSIDESGYVSDDEAAELDFSSMLAEMQSDEKETNKARSEAGFESVNIVGWAEPPHYDSAQKKLYWAKELKFGDSSGTTLNYDVRILGRRGYLQLQAVAPMVARDEVDTGMKTILPVADFSAGNRYADFDSSTDNIAAYGIGALIGGKVAAKIGLFAVFAKFGKLIAVGALGIFVAAKKFIFGRKKNDYADEEEEDDDAGADPED